MPVRLATSNVPARAWVVGKSEPDLWASIRVEPAHTGRRPTRSFGHERYSSSHSKKVRPAVGRQICLTGCIGRAQKHRLESDGQQPATARQIKRETTQGENQRSLVGHWGRRYTTWIARDARAARGRRDFLTPPWNHPPARPIGLLTQITFWRNTMNGLTISLAVGASALLMTAASAAPLSADVLVLQQSNIQNVRMICNESGRCWRERDERRVIIGEPRESYGYAPRER